MKIFIWLFYLPIKSWIYFWGLIWRLSEYSDISLGRLGPFVFKQMLKYDGKAIKLK
jgi:hypothetical protein